MIAKNQHQRCENKITAKLKDITYSAKSRSTSPGGIPETTKPKEVQKIIIEAIADNCKKKKKKKKKKKT